MDRKEIQNLTREYFKKLGFQVIKNVKFYYDPDTNEQTVVEQFS